jgi:hypothetical protein
MGGTRCSGETGRLNRCYPVALRVQIVSQCEDGGPRAGFSGRLLEHHAGVRRIAATAQASRICIVVQSSPAVCGGAERAVLLPLLPLTTGLSHCWVTS